MTVATGRRALLANVAGRLTGDGRNKKEKNNSKKILGLQLNCLDGKSTGKAVGTRNISLARRGDRWPRHRTAYLIGSNKLPVVPAGGGLEQQEAIIYMCKYFIYTCAVHAETSD